MNICRNNVVHTTAAATDNDQTDNDNDDKLVRRYEATRRDEAKPGPADAAHTRQHVQLDGAVFDVFTLGQNTNLPIGPFLRLETWRVAVCVCTPAGRPVVRYGGDRGTANVRSSLKLNMRLFAISDIHTDYKENLEWIQEHARSWTNGTSSQPRNPSLQDETVLLVAGDVCDDVVQFRKVRHTHYLVGYGRNARVERRAEDGRGPR